MPVMFLDHPRIGVTELSRDHRERHAAHREPAGIGMAQRVEVGWRIDACRRAGCRERALLLGFAPSPAIRSEEQAGTAGPPCGESRKELVPFLRQDDMPR